MLSTPDFVLGRNTLTNCINHVLTPVKGYNCIILALEELVELHIFGSCVHKACLQMPLNLILINIATADFSLNNILIDGI